MSAKLASDLASKRGLEKTLDELNVFLAQYAPPTILCARTSTPYATVHPNPSLLYCGYLLYYTIYYIILLPDITGIRIRVYSS